MKKTRFTEPYRAKLKTNFPQTKGKSGVYLIQEDGKIVYIGYSSTNIYRTMYRHFEKWTHDLQDVVTYVAKMNRKRYTVRLVLCSPAKASKLEIALVKKYKPRDNRKMYQETGSKSKDTKAIQEYEDCQIYTGPLPF